MEKWIPRRIRCGKRVERYDEAGRVPVDDWSSRSRSKRSPDATACAEYEEEVDDVWIRHDGGKGVLDWTSDEDTVNCPNRRYGVYSLATTDRLRPLIFEGRLAMNTRTTLNIASREQSSAENRTMPDPAEEPCPLNALCFDLIQNTLPEMSMTQHDGDIRGRAYFTLRVWNRFGFTIFCKISWSVCCS